MIDGIDPYLDKTSDAVVIKMKQFLATVPPQIPVIKALAVWHVMMCHAMIQKAMETKDESTTN